MRRAQAVHVRIRRVVVNAAERPLPARFESALRAALERRLHNAASAHEDPFAAQVAEAIMARLAGARDG